jgi:hypothetical protein
MKASITYVVCHLVGALGLALSGFAQTSAPRLSILPPNSNGWVRVSSSLVSNSVLSLEASSSLAAWQRIATTHDALRSYPDLAATNFRQRFYRASLSARTPTNDWKNQLLFPDEAFRSDVTSGDGVRWVKFTILLDDPVRVFYQHSTNFPFHYEFARQRLAPFLGIDRAAFDAVTLRRTNQQAVLGAVLYPPGLSFLEYGVQFVGLDPYFPEDVARWLELVRATVHPEPRATAFYLPTFEQFDSAQSNKSYFEARDIPIMSIERWVEVNHCYSPGWAFGRLKFFAASEIAPAYADGRLRPEDILLTDGVPAEMPLVAGIITLRPSTPNSHTAILATSFGIPFVYLPDPVEQERVQQIVGHEVILRAVANFGECEVKVIDAEGLLTPAQKAELLVLKQAAPIQFAPKAAFGAISASTDALVPSDIQFFGGKAANYGLLRRWVPGNCPPAIAFSFDLWDAFLGQTLPSGLTLRTAITLRLAPYTNYPPDVGALTANLAAIRDLIRNTATFTPVQQQIITNALRVFNPQRKIRFRSSTNVEDSEHFTGAGLYDSFSGCLLDDLDGDAAGPSRCDAAEANERGVFRAMQRVYASFYNDNAFLERLRHRVDESNVGMGVLVHHSFPDEEELANGVAALRFSLSTFGTNVSGDLVTQFGATPVTNPDGSASPEIVDAVRFNAFTSLVFQQGSSLVPLGAYVMNWEGDYQGFMDLFTAVGFGFKHFYPAKNNFYLDFEYKKDVNLGLVVKQVREIPRPDTTNQIAPIWIDEPTSYCVAQQEFGDVFANHRLKSLCTLRTSSLRLAASNLTQTLYRDCVLEYLADTNRQTLTGPMASWPNASSTFSGATEYDSWTTGNGNTRRDWQLETPLVLTVTGSQPPIFTQQDFRKTVTVHYARPVPALDFQGNPTTTTDETVLLVPCPNLRPGAILRQQIFTGTNAANGRQVTVDTSYYWPRPPRGIVAGYTAPLIQFVETRLTGLTTNVITLRGYYSQTYRPGHHNFSEEFIFEPRLEPGLSASTLAELSAANVQFLHVHWHGEDRVTFTLFRLDGSIYRW